MVNPHGARTTTFIQRTKGQWVAYVLAGLVAVLLALVLTGQKQGPTSVILHTPSPAPLLLKRLQAGFTMADLQAAARLTGYLNCTGALNLTRNQIEASSASDVALEAAQVACAAPEVDSIPPRSPFDHCCQRTIYIRPRTSDVGTFNDVIGMNGFYFLYAVPQLKDAAPQYILDAGGNVGYTALQLSLLFPNATIITVEPDPNNFVQLKKNTSGRKNVIPLNVGLWGWSAHVSVVHSYGENGYVFQEVPAGQGGTPALSIVDIMTRYNVPAFDIIKIDIEGAEVSVFDPKSDFSWMRPSSTQIVAIEVHPGFAHHFNVTREEMQHRVDRVTGAYVHRHDNRELDVYFGRALAD